MPNPIPSEDVNIGTWIRFVQDGKLVIEEVRYVSREFVQLIGTVVHYITASGITIHHDNVLEIRNAVDPKHTR